MLHAHFVQMQNIHFASRHSGIIYFFHVANAPVETKCMHCIVHNENPFIMKWNRERMQHSWFWKISIFRVAQCTLHRLQIESENIVSSYLTYWKWRAFIDFIRYSICVGIWQELPFHLLILLLAASYCGLRKPELNTPRTEGRTNKIIIWEIQLCEMR